MEPECNPPIDYKFVVGFLLEMVQQQSLDQLVHKLLAKSLEEPGASVAAVVIWLIENGDPRPAELSNSDHPNIAGTGNPQSLYAVAGIASKPHDANEQPTRFPDQLARIPLGSGPIGRMVTTKEPCLICDLDRKPEEWTDTAGWFQSQHIRGFVAVPLLHQGQALGVLGSFHHTNPPPERLEFGRIVAEHIAAAVVIVRSFEEVHRLKTQLEHQNAYLRAEVVEAKAFGDLVGQSGALSRILHQIDLVASTDASVLILGETGTGKELIAHEIHRQSHRRDKPLIRVNCASVPKDLYESEFFGHAKGAFTGAIRDRVGRFEMAQGGTLFLDEIGEVPLDLQSKLLRVLQDKHYERVGEDRTRRADVRIIAATNRDIKKEVEAGRFREDLYYRLNVFPIQIAPLRQRRDDIPLLTQYFLQRSVKELRCPQPRLTQAGLDQLQQYDWPGNVRELRNVIERAVILARGGVLEFDLPVAITPAPAQPLPPHREHDEPAFLTEAQLRQRECDNLLRVLDKTRWKIKGPDGAAELLGVKPNTLLARMRSMKLKRPQ